MSYRQSEPIYVISVVARMLNTHPQTLRYYERLGLIQPSRPQGRIRLYSSRDLAKLQLIQRLVNELGVNLAGVEVIIGLMERLSEMEAVRDDLRRRLSAVRACARRGKEVSYEI